MKMINKIKKLAGSLALASALLPQQLQSADVSGSLEVLAGDKSTTTDLKANVKLPDDFSLFARNRIENSYNSTSSPLTLLDLKYNSGKGFFPMVEGLFTQKGGAIGRLGYTYEQNFGPIRFTFINLCDIADKSTIDLHPIVTYSKRLNDNWKFVSGLEVLSNIGLEGIHNSTTERARVGLDFKGYTFGIGTDIKQVGKTFDDSYNFGAFLSKKF